MVDKYFFSMDQAALRISACGARRLRNVTPEQLGHSLLNDVPPHLGGMAVNVPQVCAVRDFGEGFVWQDKCS